MTSLKRAYTITGPRESCWLWPRGFDRDGYGRVTAGNRVFFAHRVTYTLHRGAIPDGFTIDHLCRNRACVNPWHMEPVSGVVNTLRGQGPAGINAKKTYCRRGHLFDPTNTLIKRRGERWERRCRECHNAGCRARYAARVSA